MSVGCHRYDNWLSRGADKVFDENETDLIPWIEGDGWIAKIGNVFVFGMILCSKYHHRSVYRSHVMP